MGLRLLDRETCWQVFDAFVQAQKSTEFESPRDNSSRWNSFHV